MRVTLGAALPAKRSRRLLLRRPRAGVPPNHLSATFLPATTTSTFSFCSSSNSRRCFSSSNSGEEEKSNENDNNNAIDYKTNDGLIEGVWIFCRHGDRSPGRVLSPAHHQQKEGSFWTSRLPYPSVMHALGAFGKYFPPSIYEGTNDGQFLDARRNPYGFLTQKGLGQLKENGHRFFTRYNQHAHHLPQRNLWRRGHAADFLDAWKVKVYSTNYIRTIMSAQSFLDGLLGTHCFSPSTERTLDPDVTKEESVPDHAWAKERFFSHANQRKDQLVPIEVRQLQQDPLNAFDRNPEMMAELVKDVMKQKEFNRRDSAAAPLASRLANIMPGLVGPHRSGFASRSPSGINWVEAADHFVCRESHGIRLSEYSDFDKDDRVEQTLKAMSYQTKSHLSWRFRQWYQSKPLLAAIAAPPLREIVNEMKQALVDISNNDCKRRPFRLYACHDITILGLLYGLGASFLANETMAGADYWPPYASALVFELVRIDKNDNANPTNAGDEFALRVLVFDGGRISHVIESVDFDDDQQQRKRGTGVDGMLRVQDLEDLVAHHETVGGSCATL